MRYGHILRSIQVQFLNEKVRLENRKGYRVTLIYFFAMVYKKLTQTSSYFQGLWRRERYIFQRKIKVSSQPRY
jgi:hypothetical protein